MNKYLNILRDLNQDLESYTEADWKELLSGLDKDSGGFANLEKFVLATKESNDFNSMNIYADFGTKVMYMGQNGLEFHRKYAEEAGLKVGEIYTVHGTEVGNWSSAVFLMEFKGKEFNTVMFKEVKGK